jgi:hypothetical protein
MIPLTRTQSLKKIRKMIVIISCTPHYAEVNCFEMSSLFAHLSSWNVVIQETKIDVLISDSSVKWMILRVLIKLTQNSIIGTWSACAKCVCVHPHFECERCIGHAKKRWSRNSNGLTRGSNQRKTGTSSIVTWWLIGWCIVANSIKIIVQIL